MHDSYKAYLYLGTPFRGSEGDASGGGASAHAVLRQEVLLSRRKFWFHFRLLRRFTGGMQSSLCVRVSRKWATDRNAENPHKLKKKTENYKVFNVLGFQLACNYNFSGEDYEYNLR